DIVGQDGTLRPAVYSGIINDRAAEHVREDWCDKDLSVWEDLADRVEKLLTRVGINQGHRRIYLRPSVGDRVVYFCGRAAGTIFTAGHEHSRIFEHLRGKVETCVVHRR